jgi:hypothetical protein
MVFSVETQIATSGMLKVQLEPLSFGERRSGPEVIAFTDHWKIDSDRRAHTHLALNVDLPVHVLNHTVADGHTETIALPYLFGRKKWFEDPPQNF